MFSHKQDLSWSPLYFLSALGAGGMVKKRPLLFSSNEKGAPHLRRAFFMPIKLQRYYSLINRGLTTE